MKVSLYKNIVYYHFKKIGAFFKQHIIIANLLPINDCRTLVNSPIGRPLKSIII